jgi:hypothetical protein
MAELVHADGYARYSGKPVTPDVHEKYFVPQTVADGWECWCSCGQFRAFESEYAFDRDQTLMALELEHVKHIFNVKQRD